MTLVEKHLLLLVSLLVSIVPSSAQILDRVSLVGQQWIWTRYSPSTSVGSGMIWSFFSKHRFTATHWYSGGAYFKEEYSGTYHYDPTTQTVFLKYKKLIKGATRGPISCIQIVPSTAGPNGYMPIFYSGWTKAKGQYKPIQPADSTAFTAHTLFNWTEEQSFEIKDLNKSP